MQYFSSCEWLIHGDMYGCGLKHLMLLKYPCSPERSTDAMESLSKFQWHFLQEKKKKPPLKLYGTAKDNEKPKQS